MVYYPPDGTGRDTYIISGNGNTSHEYRKSPHINFELNNFLRTENVGGMYCVTP